MQSTMYHFVDRLRQLFVENIAHVATFLRPTWRSALLSLDELGSARWSHALTRFGEQTLKALLRSFLPVLGLGLALRYGAASLALATGELGRPILESFVLLILVRDALPLTVALFLALRQGAPLTTKFAFAWVEGSTIPTEQERQREILPHLVASVVAGGCSFSLLAWLALYGYLVGSPLAGMPDFTTFDALMGATLRTGYLLGLAKAALFGALVIYVALALGWQAGLEQTRALQQTRKHYPHYYIWEAASLSLVLCVGITIVLWQPLGAISL